MGSPTTVDCLVVGGSFAWVESVAMFVTDSGEPTFADTGKRWVDGLSGEPFDGQVTRTAGRGSRVALPAAVAERGVALGMVEVVGKTAKPEPKLASPVQVPAAVGVDSWTDDELIAWMSESTAKDVLSAATSRARAQRFADAEALAESPRTSLISRLGKIK